MATGNYLTAGNVSSLAPFTATAARATKGSGPFIDVVLLDAAADEYADSGVLPTTDALAASASVKVGIIYAMASATSGNVVLSAQVRRHAEGVNGYTRSLPTAVTATVAVPGTAGLWDHAEITLTNAEADGLAAGESCLIRIGRVGSSGSDTATGDLELIGVYLKQA